MNREEEKMLLQNEKAMMNQLKKDLEKEEVPLGVYPSMMKEKLIQQTEQHTKEIPKTKKKWGIYRRLSVVLGAVLVLLVSGVVLKGSATSWFSSGNDGMHEEEIAAQPTEEKTSNSEEATKENLTEKEGAKGNVAMAESYEQLFEMFRKQGKVIDPAQRVANDYVYVMEDASVAFTETTTATGATNGTVSGAADSTSESKYYAEPSEAEGDFAEDVSSTNVQEQGVDEGDIIKTDGKFIYILQENENAIRVVKADGGDMKECENYLLPTGVTQEMYISGDTISVITQSNEMHYYDKNGTEITEVEANNRQAEINECYQKGFTNEVDLEPFRYYTVSKPYITAESLKVNEDGTLENIGTYTQDGSYHSSRLTEGVLYLFTQYSTNILQEDGSLVEEYVPRINGECLEVGCIAIPEVVESDIYVVCSAYEPEHPETIIDTVAVLTNGYSEQLYVSENSIYITNTQYYWEDSTIWDSSTEITKFNYDKGNMSPQGNVFVSGRLLNSFSLDEHNGYLRMVTTGTVRRSDSVQSNQLYVINENLELVGQIEGIAEGESIQSARFMGDVGYFVTYKNVDPLFSVDLTDPTNPKIMDALKIPGFSSYLHFYSKDLLLGIGQETDPDTGRFLGLKVSMFDIADPYNIVEADKYVIGDGDPAVGGEGKEVSYSEVLYNHKAVLINPERNILGFPVELVGQWDRQSQMYAQECRYVIFGYGEDGFYNTFTFGQECDRMRGVYIGNTLYICAWDNQEGEIITAFDMTTNYSKIGELVLEKEYTQQQGIVDYAMME